MNSLHFCKMHGLGNDFIIIDGLRSNISKNIPVTALADRQRGVGFDQLLWLKPSRVADVYCQIFNADGSEAEQCGNGMRCVARYVQEEGISSKSVITIETKAGIVEATIKDYQHIRVNMGIPKLNPRKVTAMMDEALIASLTTLSLGNPHAIQRVDSLLEIPVAIWAKRIASHTAFPDGVNIGFIEVVHRKKISLRTHERGVGETPACGSNACAAAIAGIVNDWLDNEVEVEVAGGRLRVEWQGPESPVFMTGPAARVYSGVISLAELPA
jgi:diaminopimelate epimerase